MEFLSNILGRVANALRSDIGSKIKLGAFWSMVGAVLSRGSVLVASIAVARILGSELYGEFGIIRSTTNTFLAFASFSLGMTATRHVAQFKVVDPQRAGRIIAISSIFSVLIGLVVATALYLTSPTVANSFLKAPHLTQYIQISAIIILISAIAGAQTGVLVGFEAYKLQAKLSVVSGFFSSSLLVVFSYFWSVGGAVASMLISAFFLLLLNHFAVRRLAASYSIRMSYKSCASEMNVLWGFSLPASLSGISVSLVTWVASAMLVRQAEGYSQMGILDAATQWRMMILFVPGVVSQIILPMLTGYSSAGDVSKFKTAFKYNVAINLTVTAVFALMVSIFSSWIMGSYGEEFRSGAFALTLLAISTVFSVYNNLIGQLIASKGRMWIGFVFNSMWAIVFILTSYQMISFGYGVEGIAWATLLSYFAHSVWQSIYIHRKVLN